MINKNFSSYTDPRVDFFDSHADNWDSQEDAPTEVIKRLGEIDDLLKLRPGMDLLEVGCGTGRLTRWLAQKVAPGKVVGVDFAPRMLQVAENKGISAEFRLADVCNDDLGDRRFDLAFCFHCFPHFRDQASAVKNLARALKPTGRLVVVHLSSRDDINSFHDDIGGSVAGDHLPDEKTWENLLEEAGMQKTTLLDEKGLYFLDAVGKAE